MKILIVNIHYKTGGIKKSLDNIVKYLSKSHVVDLLFFNSPNNVLIDCKNDNVNILNPIFSLDTYFSNRKELLSKSNMISRYLTKLFFKFKRLLYGSEKTIKQTIDALSFSKEYDVAISFSHDIWDEKEFSGGCNYFVLNKVKAQKKYAWIHGEIHNIGLNEKRALTTYTGFDKVINVSKACDKEFKLMTKSSIPSDYIYNLFDFKDIIEKANVGFNSFDESAFTFVTVGRIHPVKRIDKINIISKKLSDENYRFQWIVVGDGMQREEYQKDAKKLGIDNMVHYIGNDSNPYKYIKKANMFVLLSDSESFSIVINEAFILGVPVVTTDFPAAFETVTNNVNGYIIDKSIDEAYKIIKYCLDNKERIYNMKKWFDNNPWSIHLEKNSKNKIDDLLRTN